MAIKLKTRDDEEAKVYGNENFGIPKDYTKKQRFNALKLAFYLIAVVAICITGYKYYSDAVDRFLPEITYDRTNQPLIYSTTKEGIILKTQNGKSYDVGEFSDNGELSSSVTSASMGKSVFFLDREENGEQRLCYYNLSTDEVVTIDSGVSDFKVDYSGKFVVYRKEDVLFFSDTEEKHSVSEDVSEYYLTNNNQAIVLFKDDGTSMYTCLTQKGSTPVLVDNKITKVVSEKNTNAGIYYIKDSKLYLKEQNTPRKLIGDEIIDAIMLGNSVYYTTKETYERRLGEFFVDDVLKSDELLTTPDGADYIKEVDGLSFFDEEAFIEADELYSKKLVRDEIREYFKNTPKEIEGYSLYMYSEGDESRVDINLVEPTLSYNSCKNILLYKKYDTVSLDKKNLSEVESIEDALLFSDELLTQRPDEDMYLVKERKRPYLAFEEIPTMQTEISLDGKYIYCIENGSDEAGKILTKYEIGSSSLKGRTVVTENVTDFFLDGSDSSAVIVFCDEKMGLFYEDKFTQLSEKSYREFFFVDGTLFFYDEYDYAKQSGKLCSFRYGKVTVIDTNVHSFRVRKYNAVSYIKNYNPKNGAGTLYIKEGKNIKRQSGHVTAIIN